MGLSNELRTNTISRIERYGFMVVDNGGKKAPHRIKHPGPLSAAFTVQRAMTDDQLYTFADILDALDYVGRLKPATDS